MKEYIDKEYLIKKYKNEYCTKCLYLTSCGKNYCWVKDFITEIYNTKSVNLDVAPPEHGEWEYIGTDKMGNVFRCSNCANRIGLDKETDYCPNCGAKMNLEV